MGAGALWAMSLNTLGARKAYGAVRAPSPYGEPVPAIDETTGLSLIKLPPGFRVPLGTGWNGDMMSDGIRTPTLHDGMAVVDALGGNSGQADSRAQPRRRFHRRRPVLQAQAGITYRNDGAGGTTNHLRRQTRRWFKAWLTLAGTIRNCAGGVRRGARGSPVRKPPTPDTAGASTSAARRRPAADHRHGPLLARSADGRPGHRIGVRERRRQDDSGFYRLFRTSRRLVEGGACI